MIIKNWTSCIQDQNNWKLCVEKAKNIQWLMLWCLKKKKKCKNLPVVRHSYWIEASIGVDVIVVVIVVPTVWHERSHVKMFRKCHKCLYFLMEVIGMFKSLDTKSKTFASLTRHQLNCHFKKLKLYGAFHNVLRDYKHLRQVNQGTYLNGIVHSHRKTEKGFFDN